MKLIALLIALLIVPNFSFAQNTNDMQSIAADQSSFSKLFGKWYEIARLPFSYEDGCYGVTSEFTALPNGRIGIQNVCFEGSMQGEKSVYNLSAEYVSSNAFRVVITQIPIIKQLTSFDFEILYVSEDGEIIVIGDPKKTKGWILSRDLNLNQGEIDYAISILRTNDYSVDSLEFTQHQ